MILGSATRCSIVFFVVTTIVYGMLGYGGIRSPDGEVMFRTAESLADRGSFAVPEGTDWKDFGLPQGVDGRRYSLFGPGQALACVPFVKAGQLINRTKWYEGAPQWVPISHYVNGGLLDFVSDRVPRDCEPHALRFIVCSFNVLVGALAVVLFFLFARRLADSNLAACCVTILFAFGSLLMPYAGTFFSEPLGTLLVMLSLYCLVGNETDAKKDVWSRRRHWSRIAFSGLALGLAVATHITAILFAPFFLAYAMNPYHGSNRSIGGTMLAGVVFATSLGLLLVVLGYYNFVRFGSVLETGRTADPNVVYSGFVAPWRGLKGLLFSGGKGIVWFCPAAVMGVLGWRPFCRKFRFLSIVILAAVVFRVCFIACRSDWSGGFCLGPRYLVMAVPFLMLPLAVAIAQWFQEGRRTAVIGFCVLSYLCVVEQTCFCCGEIFSFLHAVKWTGMAQNFNVFENDWLYLSWQASPLLNLVNWRRGAYGLRLVPTDVGNHALWCGAALVVGAMLFLIYWRLLCEMPRSAVQND